jgi:hypothetical protein
MSVGQGKKICVNPTAIVKRSLSLVCSCGSGHDPINRPTKTYDTMPC